MKMFQIVFCFSIIFVALTTGYTTDSITIVPHPNVVEIEKDQTATYHIAASKKLAYVIGCTHIHVSTKNNDFDVTFLSKKPDESELNSKWYSSWRLLSKYMWKSSHSKELVKSWCLSPYEDINFHVEPRLETGKYKIKTSLIAIDFTCVVCLISGFLLFFLSPTLSKSATFYYSSSVGFGILASCLIFFFVVSRLLPGKQAGYTLLLGGWSLCAWFFSLVWSNITDILFEHYYIAAGYVFVAGFFSFAACYRYGPVENSRSHSIVQWTMQILALLLIYNGTQLRKVSAAIVLSLLTYSAMDSVKTAEKMQRCAQSLKRLKFFKWLLRSYGDPEPRKLLSQDEYVKQGEIETKKALEELRQFCHSPKCSPWKTLSHLESPKRFSRFIEGDNHIEMEEINSYDADMSTLTDDENQKEEDNFMSEDELDDTACEEDVGKEDDVKILRVPEEQPRSPLIKDDPWPQ